MKDALVGRIAERIRSRGPMPFAAFMAMALYEPGLGYYVREDSDIGRGGDFYTSAHLHRVFGQTMARQVEETWRHCGSSPSWTVVEQGGGRGLFASDFLDFARSRSPGFYAALEYRVIELNPSFRRRQEALLASHGARVSWHDSLAAVEPFEGVLFSNELPDALPVHLVETERKSLREVFVDLANDTFVEIRQAPSTPEIAAYLDRCGVTLPEGFRTEVHLEAGNWMRQVAQKLLRGYVITVDYGFNTADYYSEDRSSGTLICYHRHRTNEEPLARVGEQDITAHAHFTDLARVGREHGLEPLCFVPQGAFLISLGIDELILELHRELPEADYLAEVAKIKTLLMPDGMGESHKVLVQGKDVPDLPLRGCAVRNRMDYLFCRE